MPYTTRLAQQHKDTLKKIFHENVSFDPAALRVYETDASLLRGTALAVAHPRHVRHVQDLLRFANAQRIAVHPRGRGTSLSGGCVPTVPGIVVSMLGMDKIIDISAEDFTAEVEPGVCTSVLQSACEAKGLFYPPDPASSRGTSIGGNVATAAGGLRAVKYGVTRDYVLGCEAVMADGSIMAFGGKNHKDVIGLDISRLMVGSEGTLGIITRLYLKLLPRPRATASLLAGFASLEDALSSMPAVFNTGILPCAIEFMNENTLDALQKTAPVPWPDTVRSLMLYQTDGTETEVAGATDEILRALSSSLWRQKGTGREEQELWGHRRRISSASYILGTARLGGDMAVPRGSVLKAVREFEDIATRHGKRLIAFGHAGDGNIHANLHYDPDDTEDTARAKQAHEELDKAVLSFGGSISGEHGAGCTKNVQAQIGAKELDLMRRVRQVFDPNGILNPQKGY